MKPILKTFLNPVKMLKKFIFERINNKQKTDKLNENMQCLKELRICSDSIFKP